MPSFVQIGEIAWEELENVGLQHFANLQKRQKNIRGGNESSIDRKIQDNSGKAWILGFLNVR